MIPARRASKIRDLLERWPELRDPMNAGSGVPGDGGSLGLMPHERSCALTSKLGSLNRCTCAYRGVAELERLLRAMRDDRAESLILVAPGRKQSVRSLWWHVNQRYVLATSRTVDREVARGKRGKRLRTVERHTVAVYDRRVDPLLVTAGIDYLAAGWSLEVEPMMPLDMLVAA